MVVMEALSSEGRCGQGAQVGWALGTTVVWLLRFDSCVFCVTAQKVFLPVRHGPKRLEALSLEDSGTRTLARDHVGVQACEGRGEECARPGVCITSPLPLSSLTTLQGAGPSASSGSRLCPCRSLRPE